MTGISKYTINAYIMGLYMFQFGLFQPVASAFGSQAPIAVLSLILLSIALVNNGFRVKQYVYGGFLLSSVYFLLNALIHQKQMVLILSMYVEYFAKGFSGFVIGSLSVDHDELYGVFGKMAIWNLAVTALFPFVSFLDSMNYMRFGYAILPSVLMLWFLSFGENGLDKKYTVFLFAGFALMVIYGSRGVLVSVFVFWLLLFLFSPRLRRFQKFSILVFINALIMTIVKYAVLTRVVEYAYFQLGIKSYSLMKYQRMLSGSFVAAMSGRDKIYSWALQFIRESPVFGYGIAFLEYSTGYKAHNMFLQILVESGIFGFFVWLTIWLVALFWLGQISKSSVQLFKIVILFASISTGRLLVSSDLWLRPEYWFAISLLFNYRSEQKYQMHRSRLMELDRGISAQAHLNVTRE